MAELAGIERRSRRRFAVAREERIRVRASEWERVRGATDWAGLVQSSPLGLTWPVGPGCQQILYLFKIAKTLEKTLI
jgi:hypothetical protein